jgi:hypothetical protein
MSKPNPPRHLSTLLMLASQCLISNVGLIPCLPETQLVLCVVRLASHFRSPFAAKCVRQAESLRLDLLPALVSVRPVPGNAYFEGEQHGIQMDNQASPLDYSDRSLRAPVAPTAITFRSGRGGVRH